jgi:hypothetical protein
MKLDQAKKMQLRSEDVQLLLTCIPSSSADRGRLLHFDERFKRAYGVRTVCLVSALYTALY